MKSLKTSFLLFLLLAALICPPSQPATLAQSGGSAEDQRTLVQVSTYDYFAAGNYDGLVPLSTLHQYGDFGIGTFDKLDGEMVMLDGIIYQLPVSGVARIPDETIKTPFAVVTFFLASAPVTVKPALSLEALQKQIDALATNQNAFVAIRVEGKFAAIKVRSVPSQNQPYPPLTEVIKQQTVFDLTDVEGVLVGVRSPAFSKGLNAVGYHFHFVTADRKTGGHVLSLTTGDASLQVNEKIFWKLVLPPG